MSISSRLASAYKALVTEDLQDDIPVKEEVLANGQVLSDKKDIEDPSLKFAPIRHVATRRRSHRVKNNVDFFKPEYDLPTVANAVQLDGILRRVVNLFVEQIMKNGFESVSRNEKAQKHVTRRLREIELLTGLSTYEVIEQVARQLVTYANAYIIKVRDRNKSKYGKPYRLYGKDMYPVVGLFVAEATTIDIGVNPNGNIVQYKQTINGTEVIYDERDIIHLSFNKIPGTLTGMSCLLSILDDVRALRKLEEEVEILGFQYSIPLYLYKVGNKDIPPAPGEVDDVSAHINSMPAYGMLVVPGHHDIQVPTNANTSIDIMAFINHFKKRIYAGLGVSPVAMGEVETSNRNTSEVLDASMQTVTKSYQQIIKRRIEMGLFQELLLDGNYVTLDEQMEFNFPEIDLEQQIKFETNVLAKWQNNVIDLDECRNELDYDKKLKQNLTHLHLVEIPKLQAEGAIDEKIAKAKASTANKVAPSNQHGKTTGRPKYVKSTIDTFQSNVITLVDSLCDVQGITDFNIQSLLGTTADSFKIKAKQQLLDNIRTYKRLYNLTDIEVDTTSGENYFKEVNGILKDRITYFSKKTNDNLGSKILYDELNEFIDIQKEKIDALAKILIYKSLGFKTILINCDECEDHSLLNIDSNALNYSQVPPFAYGCKCTIDEESLNEFK